MNYCKHCGAILRDQDEFCFACGKSTSEEPLPPPPPPPPPHPHKINVWKYVAVGGAITMVLALSMAGFLFFRHFDFHIPDSFLANNSTQGGTEATKVSPPSGETTVQLAMVDVVGMNVEDAISELVAAGFSEPKIEEIYDPDVEKGQVVFQDIAAGTETQSNTVITLTVSLGAEPVQMPDVQNLNFAEAKSVLTQLGLVVKIEYENSDTVPEFDVIRQSISPMEEVHKGETVILVVSNGKETVLVASVAGMNSEEAIDELEGQGFVVEISTCYDNNIPEGEVVRQDPEAGTSQVVGSTITIFVSQGREAITVRFDANGGSVSPSSTTVTYGSTYSSLPTPTRTGHIFNGWYTAASGGTQVTSSTTVTTTSDQTLFAQWTVESYQVSWKTDTGYSIAVRRSQSPYAGANIGDIDNGSTVYYGDVLSISYAASTGYSLTNKGQETVTVAGNVTPAEIWAAASPSNYTYDIVYESSNGTYLGSSSVTYAYGTTNTISPEYFAGYNTPSSQSVTWDSTSPKTITFTYSPSSVDSFRTDGTISPSGPRMTFSATVECQNRTANSVQIRISWTTTLEAYGWIVYGQKFRASVGSAGSGDVQVAPFGTWQGSSGQARSATGTGWITVPLSTTSATSVSLNVYYFQTNYYNADMTPSEAYVNQTWTINIPAY